MPSTYSNNLGTQLIGNGEQAGVWGTNTNFNLGTLMEQAIASYVTQAMVTGTTVSLTLVDGQDAGGNSTPGTIYSTGTAGSPVSARNMYVELTGTGGSSTVLQVPAKKKLYFVYNNTTGDVVVKVSGGTGVTVPATKKYLLVYNGSDIVQAVSYAAAVSIASANGFAGTSDGAANPTITLSTTASGVLKGNGTAISASTVFQESGSNAGIGAAPTAYKLEVNGDIRTLPGGDLRLGSGSGTTTSGGDSLIFNDNNNLLFSTGTTTTTRMVIDSSGNVGIGTSTPAGRLVITGNTTASTLADITISRTGASESASVGYGSSIQFNNTTNNSNALIQQYSGNLQFFNYTGGAWYERMRISAAGGLSVGTTADPGAGAIYATGNITAYYSDDRLKTRKGNIENALDKVLSLDGFHYEANETAQALGYQAKPEVGLSAQQVQAVLPEVVCPAPINADYLTIHYERIIPLLVEAIKEQNKKIEALEAKLNGLG